MCQSSTNRVKQEDRSTCSMRNMQAVELHRSQSAKLYYCQWVLPPARTDHQICSLRMERVMNQLKLGCYP